jgi:hypothetical protein
MISANNPLTHNQPVNPLGDRQLLAELARDPLNTISLPDDQLQPALHQARLETKDDRIDSWRIVSDAIGRRYYGAEYPRLFTPDSKRILLNQDNNRR